MFKFPSTLKSSSKYNGFKGFLLDNYPIFSTHLKLVIHSTIPELFLKSNILNLLSYQCFGNINCVYFFFDSYFLLVFSSVFTSLQANGIKLKNYSVFSHF